MKKKISVILIITTILSCLSMSFSVMAQAVEYISAINEKEKVIIEFKDSPVLETLAKAGMGRNESKENLLLKKLNDRRKEYLISISKIIGKFSVDYSYTNVINGVSIECTKKNEQKLRKLDFVKNVYEVSELQIITSTDDAASDYAVDSMNVIGVDSLRKLGYDGTGTAVAVIDIDIQTDHPALKLTNPSSAKFSKEKIAGVIASNEMNSDKITADECYVNSKIPFAFDYEEQDSDVSSLLFNHGTHVSGIIAGNNNVIKGVAPEAQILMFKVSNMTGNLFLDNLLAAIDDASKFDIDAINMSIGWAEQTAKSSGNQLIENAITTAKNNGIVVCAASGNSSVFSTLVDNPDNSLTGVPSIIQDVFSVGAADNDGVTEYSSYGVSEDLKLTVDIAAPGTSIYSSVAGNAYEIMDGTSMSSPHVSGAALLMAQYVKDKYPELTGRDKSELIENLIATSAEPVLSNAHVSSPRVQGAGLMRLSNIPKTNVILTGEDNNCSVNLGDCLTDEIEFTFSIKNVSSTYVTYDSLSEQTITDEYSVETRTKTNYLTLESKIIPSTCQINSGKPVELAPGEERDITVTIDLDDNVLLKNEQIFTNGFYIEGYVFLRDTTGTQSPVSIPFMGFDGNWAKVPSVEVDEENSYFYALRTLKELKFELLDSQNTPILTNTKEYVIKGSEFYTGIWLFENMSDTYSKMSYPEDGEYTMRVTAVPACEDGEATVWTMPLTLNTSETNIEGFQYTLEGDKIYLNFYAGTNEINEIVITGGTVFNFRYRKNISYVAPDNIDGYGYMYKVPVDKVLSSYVYEFKIPGKDSAWVGSYSLLCRLFRWIFGM